MTKVATTGIIWDRDKVLIGQRKRDGRWELPGGKVDPGETPGECIVREIHEELGLRVRVEKNLGVVEGEYRGIPMKVHAFVMAVIGGTPSPNVHLALEWIALRRTDEFDIVEEDRIVLEKWRLMQGV